MAETHCPIRTWPRGGVAGRGAGGVTSPASRTCARSWVPLSVQRGSGRPESCVTLSSTHPHGPTDLGPFVVTP